MLLNDSARHVACDGIWTGLQTGVVHAETGVVIRGQQPTDIRACDPKATVDVLKSISHGGVAICNGHCRRHIHVAAKHDGDRCVALVHFRENRRGERPALADLFRWFWVLVDRISFVGIAQCPLDQWNQHLCLDHSHLSGTAFTVTYGQRTLSSIEGGHDVGVDLRDAAQSGARSEIRTPLLRNTIEHLSCHIATDVWALQRACVECNSLVPCVHTCLWFCGDLGVADSAVNDRVLHLMDHVHSGDVVRRALDSHLLAQDVCFARVVADSIECRTDNVVGVRARSPVLLGGAVHGLNTVVVV